MDQNKLIQKSGKIISHPFVQIVAQTAIALSGNPEIMKYSGTIGVVQAEFSNFVNILLNSIEKEGINLEKANKRESYFFIAQALKEVYFEENEEKRKRYRDLILSVLKESDYKNINYKEHLITLTQINEKEIFILKQIMVFKTDKNGFINEFGYWEVFNVCEKNIGLTKEDYQGYINHLIGLGLLNHSQNSVWGGDISHYSITKKGISFFKYILWSDKN